MRALQLHKGALACLQLTQQTRKKERQETNLAQGDNIAHNPKEPGFQAKVARTGQGKRRTGHVADATYSPKGTGRQMARGQVMGREAQVSCGSCMELCGD